MSHFSLPQGAQQFNLVLTEAQLAAFDRYGQELIAWNKKVNLTRITEPDEITVKHFLDSLSIYPVLAGQPPAFKLIDVGTGPGFPGLPLKIVRPDIRLALLESTGKKTAFLEHVVRVLELKHVTVLTARAEEAGQEPHHRENYDVAVARALAPLPVLAEYTLPLVKVGGLVVAQKGQYPADELKGLTRALGILGGRLERVLPVDLPGLEAARHLVLFRKTKPTPRAYPRRPGLPAKKPL